MPGCWWEVGGGGPKEKEENRMISDKTLGHVHVHVIERKSTLPLPAVTACNKHDCKLQFCQHLHSGLLLDKLAQHRSQYLHILYRVQGSPQENFKIEWVGVAWAEFMTTLIV